MSQSLSQVMGQYMRLEQRLTPQLIQSMEILQLSTQALEQRLAEELEKNVTLELARDGERSESVTESGRTAAGEAGAGEHSASFNRLDRFSRENGLDFDERASFRFKGRPVADGERDAKLDAMANTASRPEGIDEHLLHQWNLLELDDDARRAGEAIIYHLEEDGYLKIPLETIAEDTRPPVSVQVIEQALQRIQRLDPIGIAARDYRECLLLQLDAMPGDNTIERKLICDHMDDVIRNRYPAVAKATGYSVGEITAAMEAITESLVLHPAYLVVDRRVPRIYPDVIIEEDDRGKGLVVRLSRGNLPELHIKQEYVDMLRSKSNGKDVRDFVRKQVESGNALIEAVRFRRSRLMEVAQAVVAHQAEFFQVGPPGLRILLMSDLAEELGCDPSTISRTVADKYTQTPYGVYPLRYFFTGGTETGNGVGTSWDSVKERVKEIVKSEDPSNPLNDDRIAEALSRENISISRRTVAKYRAQLAIPPSRQRRKF
ncbi:MAG: RNA polymerase factor sigma-54 [Phycisphaerae bacterium]